MAIILNDNIKVQAPKPSEFRYFHPDNRPWVDLSEVTTTIPMVERHIGLTVNIDEVEYWFQTSINDGDLVIKQSEVDLNLQSVLDNGSTAIAATPSVINLRNYDLSVDYPGTYTVAPYAGVSMNLKIGKLALESLGQLTTTKPFANTVIGDFAMRYNTGSNGCTVIGYNAAQKLLSGNSNIAIGVQSMQGSSSATASEGLYSSANNLALGNNSMRFIGATIESNGNNVAIGVFSLGGDVSVATTRMTGVRNTAIGTSAMSRFQTGRRNNAVGDSSLFNLTIGDENTANGNRALFDLITGNKNTWIGYQPNVTIRNASNNTVIGIPIYTVAEQTESNNIIIADGVGNRGLDINFVTSKYKLATPPVDNTYEFVMGMDVDGNYRRIEKSSIGGGSSSQLLSNKLQTPIITSLGVGPGNNFVGSEPGLRSIKLKYTPGNDYFENLVQTGNVRLQLMHLDTRGATRKPFPNSGAKSKKNSFRYVKHQNGAMDLGDIYFGGGLYTGGVIKYLIPPTNSMLYIDTNNKANQEIEFEMDLSWFYGGISKTDGEIINNVGQILNQFPFTDIDLFNDAPFTNKKLQIRGEGRRNANGVHNYKTSKIFAFVFMYKNANGKWIQSELSQRFRLELGSAIYVKEDGTTERFYDCFRLKILP